MNIKQTLLVFALLLGMVTMLVVPVASAATISCGGVPTNLIKCDQTGIDACRKKDGTVYAVPSDGKCEKGDKIIVNAENTGLWGVLLMAIRIITAGVGVAAVAGILYGSILYTTASGKPEQVKKANTIIANTVLGVITYALMYSFLEFLIPGGLFA